MSHPALDRIVKQLRLSSGPECGVSDRELLARFTRARDEEAFAALVRRHGRLVLSACRQVLAEPADVEDAFQATFLVLLRKASSSDWQESLGGWLYAVAHRLAVHSRSEARRRRVRESCAEAPARCEAIAHDELLWREACAILHEELDALPARYRLPLLLCYLEGLSRDEAAKHLGWSLGALRGSLERGREHLRRRLLRRGVTLSVGFLTAVAGGTAVAGPSAELLRLTLEAVKGGGGPAAVLARAAFPTAKVANRALAALLALVVVLGAGLALRQQLGADEKPSQLVKVELPEGKGEPPAKPKTEATTLRGRVRATDGKPATGAKVFLFGKGAPAELGVSDAEGRFAIELPKDWNDLSLVVRTEGAGLDFVALRGLDPAAEVELRAVRDQAIRGHVVDTEGRPVRGVGVAVTHLGVYDNDSLDGFLAQWKTRTFTTLLPSGLKHLRLGPGALLTARTDANGRFVVNGLGAERVIHLRLSGDGVADAEVMVVNRAGFDPEPYNRSTRATFPREFEQGVVDWGLHGPDLSIVTETEKPIQGFVKEADTGKPRPGAKVTLNRAWYEQVGLPLTATTDAEGRFEIHGARKAKSYRLEAKSDPETGHLAGQITMPDTAGYAPILADIRVPRGVVVTGRVIDTGTGKGIPGLVHVGVAAANPFAKDYPNAGGGSETTSEDGTFRIVTIPGPVILMGGPDTARIPDGELGAMRYKPAVPDRKYPRYFQELASVSSNYRILNYLSVGGGGIPVQGNLCLVLELDKGKRLVRQDLHLEPAAEVAVHIRDADDNPVRGAWVTGISPKTWSSAVRIPSDECAAYHVGPNGPRLMAFFEPTQRLVGTVTVKGDEKESVRAVLGRGGSVTGRLVRDGNPVAGVVVTVEFGKLEATFLQYVIHRTSPIMTDAAGRFRIDELIPGQGFRLSHHRKESLGVRANVTDELIQVKPGEKRDLGELTPKPLPQGN